MPLVREKYIKPLLQRLSYVVLTTPHSHIFSLCQTEACTPYRFADMVSTNIFVKSAWIFSFGLGDLISKAHFAGCRDFTDVHSCGGLGPTG